MDQIRRGRPETKRIVDGSVVVSRPRTRHEDLRLYKGLHDGLISQEQYDKAVALSYSSASPRGKGAWGTVTSLAGLVRCDQCGRVMVRPSVVRQPPRYASLSLLRLHDRQRVV